ncbi:MAG TPA: DNA methyltransferase, partial [Accumulibacter sp.]|uniref:site-specific DNA-methyltransferase n=1 Tax=Accumulibacter sp. TaxID=2053492 RepID=UPI002CAFA157
METRFVELMSELFQLDEAEALDFGLYRVIRRHNREVRAFLGEVVVDHQSRELRGGRLGELLDAAFAAMGHEGLAEDRFRVKEIEELLGLKPGTTHEQRDEVLDHAERMPATKDLVREYRSRSEALRQQRTVQQDRAEVLNRLYQFFSRHYQDGDFIVERRYGKAGARYVKSTGEDTEFHWATEDMYYIKSGDIFTDFPVRLSNGQRVVFSVEPESLQATRAALKPNDKAHYELDAATRIGEVVKVRLKYLKGAQSEKQKDEIVAAVQQAGAGGTVEIGTDIRRWLSRFIARNQSDFFIHKRLKEALSEDLDIFLKTEVLDVDQLLRGAGQEMDLPRRALKVARIVREVGQQIIDFLAALEDFQKALWEKKKLVLETRYVITLDRLERYAPAWLAQNIDRIVEQQRREWKELGLGDYADSATCIRRTDGDLATPAAAQYLPLPVDTGNFDAAFKWSMLEAVTATTPLDDALDGVAIQSDNWQALNVIEEKFRNRITAVYADPPYNTDSGPINYKNGYRSASWIALMDDRLLTEQGIICITIDDYQVHELAILMNNVFGRSNQLGTSVIRNNPSGRSTVRGFSICHEYAFYYGSTEAATLARLPRSEKQIERFTQEDGINVDWRNFRKDGGAVTHRAERPKQFYPIHVNVGEKKIRIPQLSWNQAKKQWDVLESPSENEVPVWPVDEKGKDRVWSLNHTSAMDNLSDLDIKVGKDGNVQVFRRHRPSDGVLPRSWWDKNTYAAREYGSATLANLFGESSAFSFAKSPFAVQDCIWVSGLDDDSEEYVLDFFAGSGTTAHAVLDLNAEKGGARKFLLVETNQYFDTVTVPRLKKVAASRKWKSGKAQNVDGEGLFLRVHVLEQYDDTLESLNTDTNSGDSGELLFDNPAFALRYRLDRTSRTLYCSVDRFSSPFGYQLKRADGGGEARSCEVDLVESLPYLLGMDVDRLYRETLGVVMLGRNRRGQSLAVFFRECAARDAAQWVADKLAQHPADRVYTNDPAGLSFAGCDRLEAL